MSTLNNPQGKLAAHRANAIHTFASKPESPPQPAWARNNSYLCDNLR